MDQNAPKSNRSAFKRVRQNLYRNQATGTYYAWVKRSRKKFKRSLKTTDRELAGRRLRDFIADVDRLTSADAKELDFETTANRWLESVMHTGKESTHLRRKQSIAAFLPAFRLLSLRRIKQSDCEQWAAQRSQAVAPQTFAHELETLRAIFNYAAERGLILRSPALGLKRMRIVARRPNVPSRAEFASLVETIRHASSKLPPPEE